MLLLLLFFVVFVVVIIIIVVVVVVILVVDHVDAVLPTSRRVGFLLFVWGVFFSVFMPDCRLRRISISDPLYINLLDELRPFRPNRLAVTGIVQQAPQHHHTHHHHHRQRQRHQRHNNARCANGWRMV